MELTSIGPGLWDIMVDVGSAADPKVKVVAVDGFGAKANIPHDAIDPVIYTARERAYSVLFYHLVPGAWLTILLAIYASGKPLLKFFKRLDDKYFGANTREGSRDAESRWKAYVWTPYSDLPTFDGPLA